MPFQNYREQSRAQWGANQDETLSREQIALGATLRIADAVEQMAKNVVSLQAERDRYERWYKDEKERREHADRRIVSLKGVITRIQRGQPEPKA